MKKIKYIVITILLLITITNININVEAKQITHKTKKIIEIFIQTFIIKLSTVRRENRTKTDLNYISRRTYL